MAVYQVDKTGKTPSNAQTGDYIVTGGGTYEILDANQYKGMNKSQLAKAGVSLNSNSGLYSRKVTDQASPYYTNKTSSYDQVTANTNSKLDSLLGSSAYTFRNYDNTRKATDAYRDQMYAELEGNYAEDLGALKRTYNTNIANQEKQINQANSAYEKNRDQLYKDTYINQKEASQLAANRGMMNSAQGLAMNVSGLMQASMRASELSSDRDTLINDINTEMNRITEDYGIDRNTLKKKFKADKLSALSTAELQYMQACLEIDDYNADIWNNAVANKQAQDFEMSEAQKQRDFQAAEAAKQRAFQRSLAYDSDNESDKVSSNLTADQALYYFEEALAEGLIDAEQEKTLTKYLGKADIGVITYDQWYDIYNGILKSNSLGNVNAEPQNTGKYINYKDYMKGLNSNQYSFYPSSPVNSLNK